MNRPAHVPHLVPLEVLLSGEPPGSHHPVATHVTEHDEVREQLDVLLEMKVNFEGDYSLSVICTLFFLHTIKHVVGHYSTSPT